MHLFRYATSIYGDSDAVSYTHLPMVVALMTPLTRMTLRNPKRLMMGRAVAFIDIEPTADAKVMLPEANADRPNTICSSSGSKKTRVPAPARNNEPPLMLARNVGMRNTERSSKMCIRDRPKIATLVNVHEHGRTLALVAMGYNRIGKVPRYAPPVPARARPVPAHHAQDLSLIHI